MRAFASPIPLPLSLTPALASAVPQSKMTNHKLDSSVATWSKKNEKKWAAERTASNRVEKGFAYVTKHKQSHGSMTTGAKIAGMAYAAFRKRYLGARKSGPMKRGPAPALGESVEKKLYDHIKRCALVAMCLPVILVCQLAQQLAVALKIKTNVVFGPKWFTRFQKRHKRSVRLPQVIESHRLAATSSVNITRYFKVLGPAVAGVPPEKIWNMDESGISLRNTRSKVCRPRTRARTSQLSRASRSRAGRRHEGHEERERHLPGRPQARDLRGLRQRGGRPHHAHAHLQGQVHEGEAHGGLPGSHPEDDGLGLHHERGLVRLGAALHQGDGRQLHARKRERAVKKATAGARKQKPKNRPLLSQLLSPVAFPGSSSSPSSAASSGAPAAVLFTPPVTAGAGGVGGFAGGGSDFQSVMGAAAFV